VISPLLSRGLVYDELHAQLRRLLPSSLAVTNTITLEMAATNERYLPDLLVIKQDILGSGRWLVAADQADLVVRSCHRTAPTIAG
jgi:hypothetical protein